MSEKSALFNKYWLRFNYAPTTYAYVYLLRTVLTITAAVTAAAANLV